MTRPVMAKRPDRQRGRHGNYGRDYSDKEAEFLKAMDKYQREQGLRFPAKTDYFHVMTVILGYKQKEQRAGNSEPIDLSVDP